MKLSLKLKVCPSITDGELLLEMKKKSEFLKISLREIRVKMQQRVRKKKRPVLMLTFSAV